MKNLMNKIRKSNKGFTLVELIIVVAIIAILTVAVAPQYLKYVEKSRQASDLNAIEEVLNVMSVAVADPANTAIKDGTITVTVDSSSDLLVLTDTDTTGVPTAVGGLVTMPKIQSTKGQALNFTIEIEKSGAGVVVSTAGQTALEGLNS